MSDDIVGCWRLRPAAFTAPASSNTLSIGLYAVTENAARVMGLEGYGIEVGCDATFVLLQARDTIEAIRMSATRLAVIKGGKVIIVGGTTSTYVNTCHTVASESRRGKGRRGQRHAQIHALPHPARHHGSKAAAEKRHLIT